MSRKFVLLTTILMFAMGLMSFTAVAQDSMDMDPPPGFESWDAVVEAARGGTVNWYLWGGSDSINAFVDTFYGVPLMEEYGITSQSRAYGRYGRCGESRS